MRRFTLALSDGDVAGIRFGADGPPDLVFLHATGFNALTYRDLLEPLAGRYRVVALDQRGHGLSTLPAMPQEMSGWDLYGRDMLAVFDALGDGAPFVLAGHSMGGAVSMMAAEQRPDRVASLVLLDPVMPTAEWITRLFAPRDLDARIESLPIARAAPGSPASRRRSRPIAAAAPSPPGSAASSRTMSRTASRRCPTATASP